jgi:hypothetical protein|tara:strand:- start:3692 stop:4525 length:834 start_codon:yes stop_codon:yes gene_type:complete
LKQLAIFSLFCGLFALVACDKELKEHPISPQVQQEMAAREKASDPTRSISGTIEFEESIASKIPENGTLFLIARPEGVTGGPPMAARKHSLIQFPFEFKIGQENVMMEGNSFEGKIKITARWDLDGQPKASPDDVEGSVIVPAGSTEVKIVLDHVIEVEKASAEAKTVTGTIRIDPALADQMPQGASLFLIARSEGVQRGMPLAVKKLAGITFPYAFSLGQADVMLPGAVFDGPVTIFARLDKDGDAAPAPGDIDGKITTNAGDQNAEIVLNRLIGG